MLWTGSSHRPKGGALTLALVSLFQENVRRFPKFKVDCGVYHTLHLVSLKVENIF